MSDGHPIRDISVGRLVDVLGQPAPAPSGGSAAAVAGACAAALVVLVARASPDWAEAPGTAAQAAALRDRLLALADTDAAAFADALAALQAPAGHGADRDTLLGRALGLAADAPLAIAEAAADVVVLADLAAASGRSDVRPDAVVARELAAAAARAAAALVETNLATLPGDPRSIRAAAAVEAVVPR